MVHYFAGISARATLSREVRLPYALKVAASTAGAVHGGVQIRGKKVEPYLLVIALSAHAYATSAGRSLSKIINAASAEKR
jgi:hypothetical protein